MSQSTLLYSSIDRSQWLSEPSFVRYRTIYRGPHESYKLNRTNSSWVFDIQKLYEKYAVLGMNFNNLISTLDQGGAIYASSTFPSGSLSPISFKGIPDLSTQIELLDHRIKNLELGIV